MARAFAEELKSIKQKYDYSISLVTDASNNLGGFFKEKMIKIKGNTAKYFAEMDLRMNNCQKDVLGISKIV
jgi:hypothetical protein